METTITSRLPYDMPPELALTDPESAGTMHVLAWRGMMRRHPQPGIIWDSPDITSEFAGGEQIEATPQRIAWASPDITPEYADSEQIFDAMQSLYLSHNKTRDLPIATRIIALYRDALEEEERMLSASLRQCTAFFLKHHDLGLPRIILTPNSTLRVRWIQGTGSFTALEFTGKPLVQLVAEIPRAGGETARYFSDELVDDVVSYARALGASFT